MRIRRELTVDSRRDEDELENREHAQVQISDSVANLPESEACEETSDDMQCEFVVNIFRIPVDGGRHPRGNEFGLGQQTCSKLLAVIVNMRRISFGLVHNAVKFGQHCIMLR